MADVPRYDLKIKQGGEWSITLTYKDDNGTPISLTNYKARLQFRETPNGELLIELTTTTLPAGQGAGNGKIVLGGAAGTVTCTLAGADTAGLVFDRAEYDLFLYDATDKPIPILQGIVTLIPQVSRYQP